MYRFRQMCRYTTATFALIQSCMNQSFSMGRWRLFTMRIITLFGLSRTSPMSSICHTTVHIAQYFLENINNIFLCYSSDAKCGKVWFLCAHVWLSALVCPVKKASRAVFRLIRGPIYITDFIFFCLFGDIKSIWCMIYKFSAIVRMCFVFPFEITPNILFSRNFINQNILLLSMMF